MSRDVTDVIDDVLTIEPIGSMLGNFRGRQPLAPVFFRHAPDHNSGNRLRAGFTGFLRHLVLGDVVLGGRALGVFDQQHVLAFLGVGLVQVALRADHLALEGEFIGGKRASRDGQPTKRDDRFTSSNHIFPHGTHGTYRTDATLFYSLSAVQPRALCRYFPTGDDVKPAVASSQEWRDNTISGRRNRRTLNDGCSPRLRVETVPAWTISAEWPAKS